MEKNLILDRNDSQMSLKSLWDNIDGEIHIIYPALNRIRWSKELNMLFKDHLADSPLISPALRSKEGSEELAKWISRFGPHITSGDIYACMHIIMLLSIFYGADIISLKEAFSLIKQSDDVLNKTLKNNLVLIGGPSGNPITNKILNDCGLQTIFPNAPENDFKVVMPDKISFFPSPNPNNPEINRGIEDIGVFLKRKNPYNPDKVIFAAMGSNSWGTQGAASLACSSEGANIIEKVIKSNYKNSDNLDILTCIKVFKDETVNKEDIDDNREIKFQLCWPNIEDKLLTNPHSVNQAISYQIHELRDAATSEIRIALSFGWGRAVFTVLFFMLSSILITLSFQYKSLLSLFLPASLFSLYLGIYCFLRLPNKRNY
jgi:hypothetical protein